MHHGISQFSESAVSLLHEAVNIFLPLIVVFAPSGKFTQHQEPFGDFTQAEYVCLISLLPFLARIVGSVTPYEEYSREGENGDWAWRLNNQMEELETIIISEFVSTYE